MLKCINDKRVKRLKSILKREEKKANLFEKEYVKERDRRQYLESLLFNEKEKEYILYLISQDEIINSHKHTSFGLYSELNIELFDFTSNLKGKIRNMQKYISDNIH